MSYPVKPYALVLFVLGLLALPAVNEFILPYDILLDSMALLMIAPLIGFAMIVHMVVIGAFGKHIAIFGFLSLFIVLDVHYLIMAPTLHHDTLYRSVVCAFLILGSGYLFGRRTT